MVEKILLIVSAIFWLYWAVKLTIETAKAKSRHWTDWDAPAFLLLLVAAIVVQAFGIVNHGLFSLFVSVILVGQFLLGVTMIYEEINNKFECHSSLSIIGGLIAIITAFWWLIATSYIKVLLIVLGIIIFVYLANGIKKLSE